jgi:hypothetical protein
MIRQDERMEPEPSRIVISRPQSSRNDSSTGPLAVLVDGQKKGDLGLGEDLTVDVDPGSHKVEVQFSRFTRPKANVQARPGTEPGTGPRVVISGYALRVEYPQDPSTTGRGALADRLLTELTEVLKKWPGTRGSRNPAPTDPGPTPDAGPEAVPEAGPDAGPDAELVSLDEPNWTVVQDADPGDAALTPDTVVIDNSFSDTAVTHEFRQSRQWTRSWNIATERGVQFEAGVRLPAGIGVPVHFKAQAEAVLRNQYASSAQEMQHIEHTVTVIVPPRTTTTVSFTWRKVRLAGEVKMTQRELEISVPFETVIGMSLDYSQSEAPGAGNGSPPVDDSDDGLVRSLAPHAIKAGMDGGDPGLVR